MHYHSIEFSGNLTFESKTSNFRRALSEYLSRPNDEGIQLNIADCVNKNRPSEDVVVSMFIIRMKQHPQDHTHPRPIIKPPERVAPTVINTGTTLPATKVVKDTESDTCFY